MLIRDLLLVECGALLLQAAILAALLFFAQNARATYPTLHRNFGPLMWFLAFYLFWFFFPQVLALVGDHHIVGFGDLPPADRLEVLRIAQLYLVLFLSCVLLGFVPVYLLGSDVRAAGPRMPLSPDTNWVFGTVAFAVGLIAFGFLVRMHGEGMRSELVKGLAGQVFYALTFFGSFGVAYLASHLLIRGKFVFATVIVICYAAVVFQIGARGRVLWPLVFIIVFLWSYSGRRLPYLTIVVLVAMLLGLLSVLDPVYIAVRKGDPDTLLSLNLLEAYARLFVGRSFDGLGNFATVCYYDRIPASPGILISGGRDVFMSTYHPGVLSMGVGFPPSFLGELWIAGGAMMLIVGGLSYGAVLGAMDQFVRHIRHEESFWLYLVAVPWIAAVGGALSESYAKIVAAIVPVLILIGIRVMTAAVRRDTSGLRV